MANQEKKQNVKIITPEFRVSFPSVFQARKVNQNDPTEKAKFSVQMIFRVKATPESEKRGEKVVDIEPLKALVRVIVADKLGAGWETEIKKKKGDGTPLYRLPFRDGGADDKKDADGYGPGTIFATASSQFKPGVVDAAKVEILNPQDFYGGCYARAQIHAYWYSVKGNQGVTFGLDNVQKIRDGEAFSGRVKAEDAFDAIEMPGGAVPAGAAASEPADVTGL